MIELVSESVSKNYSHGSAEFHCTLIDACSAVGVMYITERHLCFYSKIFGYETKVGVSGSILVVPY